MSSGNELTLFSSMSKSTLPDIIGDFLLQFDVQFRGKWKCCEHDVLTKSDQITNNKRRVGVCTVYPARLSKRMRENSRPPLFGPRYKMTKMIRSLLDMRR